MHVSCLELRRVFGGMVSEVMWVVLREGGDEFPGNERWMTVGCGNFGLLGKELGLR